MSLAFVFLTFGALLFITSLVLCVGATVIILRRRREKAVYVRGLVNVIIRSSFCGTLGLVMVAASIFLTPSGIGFHYDALVVGMALLITLNSIFALAFWYARLIRRNGYVAELS